MGISLDFETSVTVVSAIGVAVMFCLVTFALSGGANSRRFKRRLNSVRDRAQGVPSAEAVAARSLARQQSATPKIDRIARRWLPRRDARLARTGRAISVGQYAMVTVGLAALSAIGFACAVPI